MCSCEFMCITFTRVYGRQKRALDSSGTVLAGNHGEPDVGVGNILDSLQVLLTAGQTI